MEDEQHGTSTDNSGAFKLELPIGVYQLRLKSIGYLDKRQKIIVRNDGAFSTALSKDFVLLDEIVISAAQAAKTQSRSVTGLTTITPARLKELPAFLGEPDLIRSIVFLPGVSKVGEGALGFNVRGGNTDENLISFNGIDLFNANHALGFFGSINSNIIQSADLYKGVVPARYGGRLSSVLDVNLKSADNEQFKMSGGIGPLNGKLTLEIPLVKEKSSLLLAGRSSYSDWLLQRVEVPEVQNSSLFFYDVNVSYQHYISDKFSVNASFYLSRDEFESADLFGFDYGTNSISLKLDHQISQRLASTLTLSYTDYFSARIEERANQASRFETELSYFRINEDLQFELSEPLTLTFGGSFISYDSQPGLINPTDQISVVKPASLEQKNAWEAAGYLGVEYQINNNWNVSAGLRGSFYNLLGPGNQFVYQDANNPSINSIIDTLSFNSGERIATYSTWEPRLSLNYHINDYQTVKVGYSRMAQYLFQISNTTTVTPVDVWRLSDAHLAPPRAHNYSITWTRDTNARQWKFSIGGFYRSMSDLKDYRDFANLVVNPNLETEILQVQGRAFGVEIGLDKTFGKLTGNLAYTWSRTERRSNLEDPQSNINGGDWYPANFDKPHDLSIAANYKFNQRHSFSFSFTYYTGRPVTAPVGFFDVDPTTRVPIYSSRNELRIPDYHRLDISYSLAQGHRKTKRWKSSWTFGIYNLYGRRNPYSIFFTQTPRSPVRANRYSVIGSAIPTVTYNFNFQ